MQSKRNGDRILGFGFTHDSGSAAGAAGGLEGAVVLEGRVNLGRAATT